MLDEGGGDRPRGVADGVAELTGVPGEELASLAGPVRLAARRTLL